MERETEADNIAVELMGLGARYPIEQSVIVRALRDDRPRHHIVNVLLVRDCQRSGWVFMCRVLDPISIGDPDEPITFEGIAYNDHTGKPVRSYGVSQWDALGRAAREIRKQGDHGR